MLLFLIIPLLFINSAFACFTELKTRPYHETISDCKTKITFPLMQIKGILPFANLNIKDCFTEVIDTSQKNCGNYFQIDSINNNIVLYINQNICNVLDIRLDILITCPTPPLDPYDMNINHNSNPEDPKPVKRYTLNYFIEKCNQLKPEKINKTIIKIENDTTISFITNDTIFVNTFSDPDYLSIIAQDCEGNQSELKPIYTIYNRLVDNHAQFRPADPFNNPHDKSCANIWIIPKLNNKTIVNIKKHKLPSYSFCLFQ